VAIKRLFGENGVLKLPECVGIVVKATKIKSISWRGFGTETAASAVI